MASIHGGKQKQGREIAHKIFDISQNYEIKGYCEIFCGMLGVFNHFYDLYGEKIKYKFGDINKSTIFMWKKTQKGWIPPNTCSENEYNYYKSARDSAEKGFFCHQFAFQGQFCENYACNYNKSTDATKACERVKKIGKKAKHADFSQGDYRQFDNLKGYIIYADPPYENASQRYKTEEKFCTNTFWEWCRKMSKYNLVFISSYSAPKDFKLIWAKDHLLTGAQKNTKNKKRVEKLYFYDV